VASAVKRVGRLARSVVFPARIATASARRLPDFVVIGAQRAGTTSLYWYLVQHPDIASAYTKEIHYFDRHHARSVRWYRAHFPRDGRGRITGEATPYYLFHPQVPARLAGALPDVKLIVVLRDPVDRAYSHYWHSRRFGRESLSFEAAIEAEPKRLEGETERLAADPHYASPSHEWFSYQARGRYADQLAAWMRHVPRDRFLVIESEELFRAPARVLEATTRFLGLPPMPSIRVERRNGGPAVPPMAETTRRELRERFRPHNERLFALLGRTFAWRS
jgi:hypothetical protein